MADERMKVTLYKRTPAQQAHLGLEAYKSYEEVKATNRDMTDGMAKSKRDMSLFFDASRESREKEVLHFPTQCVA